MIFNEYAEIIYHNKSTLLFFLNIDSPHKLDSKNFRLWCFPTHQLNRNTLGNISFIDDTTCDAFYATR